MNQSSENRSEKSEARKLRSLSFLRENFLVSEQALERMAAQPTCEFTGDVFKGESCALFAFCTDCEPGHHHSMGAIDFEAAKQSVAEKIAARGKADKK